MVEVISSSARSLVRGLNNKVDQLNALNHPNVRRLVDLSIRNVEIEGIPPYLRDPTAKAILPSNYPGVKNALSGAMKIASILPYDATHKGNRVIAIARKSLADEADIFLRALGIRNFVYPALYDDKAGKYSLGTAVYKNVIRSLNEPGRVLWMSVTGKTDKNGLGLGDIRSGAVVFSASTNVPLIPLAFEMQNQVGKKGKIIARFGPVIPPPNLQNLDDIDKTDLIEVYSLLLMSHIAHLLPNKQRGDFENAEKILLDINRRLGIG